eukprot:TRINITY_DN10755_c0_g3_i10.p2 TRINITY_DN10755_c0_g3~~TRINITY_DN10755_c0_g3_i10.p2  ORF type:complete len:214 (+),score=-6.66 TRINITY_DN10755_c0_g3_i10:1206-1847(+)
MYVYVLCTYCTYRHIQCVCIGKFKKQLQDLQKINTTHALQLYLSETFRDINKFVRRFLPMVKKNKKYLFIEVMKFGEIGIEIYHALRGAVLFYVLCIYCTYRHTQCVCIGKFKKQLQDLQKINTTHALQLYLSETFRDINKFVRRFLPMVKKNKKYLFIEVMKFGEIGIEICHALRGAGLFYQSIMNNTWSSGRQCLEIFDQKYFFTFSFQVK